MKMLTKITKIIIQTIPILIMVGLIPLIKNDYILTGVYVAIILIAFILKKQKGDFIFLTVGFLAMIFFEWIFLSTGVEIFLRNSLFGIMPLWLPFLWAYAFVVMRRSAKILEL